MTLPPEAAAAIGHYVYALQDPRDGAVFYIGKGIRDRVHADVREALGTGEAAKLGRIRRVRGFYERTSTAVAGTLSTPARCLVVVAD